MATFPLKVMTIDHCFFEGDVDRIVVRTSQGDVGILPNHVPYIAALGIGALTIIQNGEKRIAAIAGGFVDVVVAGCELGRIENDKIKLFPFIAEFSQCFKDVCFDPLH